MPQRAVLASCDLAFAIMEPGKASVSVCKREPVDKKVAVGLDVSMSCVEVPLEAEVDGWLS